jgi:uncharacterized protein YlxP (DUF503 family)
MWIGAARLILDFYNNDSKHKKRENLDSLCRDIRKKFRATAEEVSDFDDLERCVIGIALVMSEPHSRPEVQHRIQEVCEWIDQNSFARVTVEDWDVYSHGN